MITPFGLRHILLMRDLQSCSTIVDVNSILAEPVSPLRAALRGYFLGPASGIFTYVLQARDHQTVLRGFAQTRVHGADLWSVVCLAPALDNSPLGSRSAGEDAATIWYRLLLHLCIAAGEHGVQRLFARLLADGPAEEVFRQAGFAVYVHEQVFTRLAAQGTGKLSSRLHPVQNEDLWHIQKLYHKVTPRLVLQVEEADATSGNCGPLELLFPPGLTRTKWSGRAGLLSPSALFRPQLYAEQGYALWGHNGEILGYLCILMGARGSWLRIMVCPGEQDRAAEMLDHALAVLAGSPVERDAGSAPRPVYCAVREYQGGMQALLEERGFVPFNNYSLLVKHTTVRIRQPLRKLTHALEKRAEIAPTVSQSGELH